MTIISDSLTPVKHDCPDSVFIWFGDRVEVLKIYFQITETVAVMIDDSGVWVSGNCSRHTYVGDANWELRTSIFTAENIPQKTAYTDIFGQGLCTATTTRNHL